MARVLIVGAGVIGLQTAITLLEAGYKVTILAERFPGDESIEYTSPWAGAIWRTHATADQTEQCQWDMESYQTWMNTIRDQPELAEQMGIQGHSLRIYTMTPGVDTSSPLLWFASRVRNFAPIPNQEPPRGCKSGYSYDSIAINPSKYLHYLRSRAKSLGAKTIAKKVTVSDSFPQTIDSALESAELSEDSCGTNDNKPIVVICAGLAALVYCQDTAMYPILGQTLLVRFIPTAPPSPLPIILHEDPSIAPLATYIVPRPGTDTFVLGGTKIPDDWSNDPKPFISEGIIERCRNVWPDMEGRGIEVLSEQVGLRPGRKGGVRLEVQRVEIGKTNGNGRVVDVVHQYGHAGAGYQNSIGSANKVLRLVQEICGQN